MIPGKDSVEGRVNRGIGNFLNGAFSNLVLTDPGEITYVAVNNQVSSVKYPTRDGKFLISLNFDKGDGSLTICQNIGRRRIPVSEGLNDAQMREFAEALAGKKDSPSFKLFLEKTYKQFPKLNLDRS